MTFQSQKWVGRSLSMKGADRNENQDEYEEMFERIDREADGEVYIQEVLDFLRSMNSDLDQSPEVRFNIEEEK